MPTLNLTIVAGADDGYSNSASILSNLSTELRVGTISDETHDAFLRFVDVTIPAGASITTAYLVYTDAGGALPASFASRLYLNDADDATPPHHPR